MNKTRSPLKRTFAVLGTCLVLTGCRGHVSLVETSDVKAVLVNASIDNGWAEAIRFKVETRGRRRIQSVELSVYADHNGNRREDPGEARMSRTWVTSNESGELLVEIAGGSFRIGGGGGKLRYRINIGYTDGSTDMGTGVLN